MQPSFFFKEDVRSRLAGKPWLEPVFSDLFDISNRIRTVDPTLFIVRNHRLDQYEVHSLAHYPNTFAWVVPYHVLDIRTIRRAWKNSLLLRGDTIFKEVDERNARHEASLRRQFNNDIDAIARETRSLFAKTAWGVL